MIMKEKLRVAVAMSGGVDSSVAALILQQQGYIVTSYTMTLGANPELDRSAVESAKTVARKLGIGHHIIDLSSDFKKTIIDYFISEYIKGKTPNPCALCNRYIKFGKLAEQALSDGNDLFATGHYARLEKDLSTGRIILKKGLCKEKDQSYFLFYLKEEILKNIIFPLGEKMKPETFKIAEQADLSSRDRPESADACFLNSHDYRHFLKEHGAVDQPGGILYLDGTPLGKHEGFHNYTIGQRKGLRIAFKEPLYVVRMDSSKNSLIVGEKEHLFTKTLKIEDINILYSPAGSDFECSVKIRYRHNPANARVSIDDQGGAGIEFEIPQRAVTPGQAAVFYQDDILIGGGWIV
jgi:tRNA-specific 2-thiouridylase